MASTSGLLQRARHLLHGGLTEWPAQSHTLRAAARERRKRNRSRAARRLQRG